MQLTVRSLENHTFKFTGNETVVDIKAFIAGKENIDVDEQLLYCGGEPLSDDSLSLSSIFQLGASIDVTVRLLGGKVHGSLARAGKVKGQTPKVEKQEKRKKKTGRAKRRFQYNRRFVNVVQGFGKRRGPNSNTT